jgi:hypothetical protein
VQQWQHGLTSTDRRRHWRHQRVTSAAAYPDTRVLPTLPCLNVSDRAAWCCQHCTTALSAVSSTSRWHHSNPALVTRPYTSGFCSSASIVCTDSSELGAAAETVAMSFCTTGSSRRAAAAASISACGDATLAESSSGDGHSSSASAPESRLVTSASSDAFDSESAAAMPVASNTMGHTEQPLSMSPPRTAAANLQRPWQSGRQKQR